MKVLSVASEIFPLMKTGGLADVAGALPLVMSEQGVEMRSLMPGYPPVMQKIASVRKKKVADFPDLFGTKAKLYSCTYEGLELFILDAPAFFNRDGGPYTGKDGKDYKDNWKRFAALSHVGAQIAGGLVEKWVPDLVHVHDWQAGLTPAYMRYRFAPNTPSMTTVHNIAFQGQFGADIFADLDLPTEAFSMHGIEYYGDVGYLKGGMEIADAVTTVSPTYAREIFSPEFGMGLEGLIRARSDVVHGIVNGIDTDIWSPETDPLIAANYSANKLKGRAENRAALAAHFGIDEDDGPIFCVISRLTWQKGMDLLADLTGEIAHRGGKLVVLGSGDKALETALIAAADNHRGRVGVSINYDEPLSHLMQAGSDAILIPSRFEPCGLTQLYALRYGCVPVVARTGGLNDTVIDANTAALSAGVATGFQFSSVTHDGLRLALHRVFDAWEDRKLWATLQKNGMKADVSWDRSASQYAELYQKLISARGN